MIFQENATYFFAHDRYHLRSMQSDVTELN